MKKRKVQLQKLSIDTLNVFFCLTPRCVVAPNFGYNKSCALHCCLPGPDISDNLTSIDSQPERFDLVTSKNNL